MADLARLLRKAVTLPPHVTVRKAAAMVARRLADRRERRSAYGNPTYLRPSVASLERVFSRPERIEIGTGLSAACDLYRQHTFDVLGSGWLRVEHGMESPGVEGHRYGPHAAVEPDGAGEWLAGRVNQSNLSEARRRWSLVSEDYRPIDWCLDIKSGYRWSESVWFKNHVYGVSPGADVKVPWEISRAQHLPQLALLASRLSVAERDAIGREVCDQILDFCATNPPAFGPNWLVSMDVGIRVANWCVAVDLLKTAGYELSPAIEATIATSVFEHADFIARNLEWFPELRSNHYLGNLAGLAFAAAYLPPSAETDSWASFAAAALVEEADRQFEADGGNFEGSTAYHRLSLELLTWSVAILRALPAERASRIGSWDVSHVSVLAPPPVVDAARLRGRPLDELFARAGRFALDAHRPDGRLIQFGDCDSGRLFKFSPVFRMVAPEQLSLMFANLDGWRPPDSSLRSLPLEEHLDARHVAGAVGAMTGRSDLVDAARDETEAAMMRALVGSVDAKEACGIDAADVRIGSEHVMQTAKRAGGQPVVRRFDSELDLLRGLETRGYPSFGLWIWRSPALYLAIRCGSVGQYGSAGHSHNDQLGLELWLDGRPVVLDPGTYLYTPLPERRNEYRSVAAHDAPALASAEPGLLTRGLFQIDRARPGVCEYFGDRGFVGYHDGYGKRITRVIELSQNEIVVTDIGPVGGIVDVAAAVPDYSPGYGMRLRPGMLDTFLAQGTRGDHQ